MTKQTSALARMLILGCAGVACAATVPVPNVTAVPVTANSFPALANSRNLGPLDLAKAGYVEEEFLISGTANVYDWAADGSLSVKTPNAPYVTRILVRRPAAAARFSGSVMVEIPNTARRFDWSMMFGYVNEQLMRQGDAWVLVSMPGSVEGIKKLNPVRYASLSFANPTPGAPCPGAGKGGPSDQEEGLRWDVLSQVAAALKSANTPILGGGRAQYVTMTVQGSDIVTYINAIHARATLTDGKPVYDGYLIKNAAAAGKISQCAAAPARGDARQAIANVNVPVVNVVAEGEVIGSLAMRKPNSDDPAGRFRQYEIAGAAHIDKNAYDFLPVYADQAAAGGNVQGTPEWPFAAPCEPAIPLSTHPLLKYAFSGAVANLDVWIRKGTAPPKVEPLGVKDAGTPQATLAADEFGNGVGGVRSPYVDVPTASYFGASPGPGTCRELGHIVALDAARIKALYSDQKQYAAKVNQSVDRAVKERLFTEADGKKMKAEILASPSVASALGGSR